MNVKYITILAALFLISGRAVAQWIVKDPFNFAQGIVNSSQEVVETAKTTAEMNQTFQQTVRIYEQSKDYYNKLRSVNNLVRSARQVQESILMVGEISDLYVNSYQRMLRDDNFSARELSAIAYGYAKLLNESSMLLNELQGIVNPSDLSMTDKDRLDVVDKVHSRLRRYRNMVRRYTNTHIAVSMLRAEERRQLGDVLALYGKGTNRYW